MEEELFTFKDILRKYEEEDQVDEFNLQNTSTEDFFLDNNQQCITNNQFFSNRNDSLNDDYELQLYGLQQADQQQQQYVKSSLKEQADFQSNSQCQTINNCFIPEENNDQFDMQNYQSLNFESVLLYEEEDKYFSHSLSQNQQTHFKYKFIQNNKIFKIIESLVQNTIVKYSNIQQQNQQISSQKLDQLNQIIDHQINNQQKQQLDQQQQQQQENTIFSKINEKFIESYRNVLCDEIRQFGKNSQQQQAPCQSEDSQETSESNISYINSDEFQQDFQPKKLQIAYQFTKHVIEQVLIKHMYPGITFKERQKKYLELRKMQRENSLKMFKEIMKEQNLEVVRKITQILYTQATANNSKKYEQKQNSEQDQNCLYAIYQKPKQNKDFGRQIACFIGLELIITSFPQQFNGITEKYLKLQKPYKRPVDIYKNRILNPYSKSQKNNDY